MAEEFDYLNDKDGIYVGFCTRKSGDKPLGDGRFSTQYHCARYSDLSVAKDNLSHVISSFGINYIMELPEETLRLMTLYLKGLEDMPSADILGDKAFVLQAKPIGIFMLTKGFPRGDTGTTFKVVQDHSNCAEGHCLELEPNFVHSY